MSADYGDEGVLAGRGHVTGEYCCHEVLIGFLFFRIVDMSNNIEYRSDVFLKYIFLFSLLLHNAKCSQNTSGMNEENMCMFFTEEKTFMWKNNMKNGRL